MKSNTWLRFNHWLSSSSIITLFSSLKLILYGKTEEILFAQAQTNTCVYQTCLKISTLFTTHITGNSCNYLNMVVYYNIRLVNIEFKWPPKLNFLSQKGNNNQVMGYIFKAFYQKHIHWIEKYNVVLPV